MEATALSLDDKELLSGLAEVQRAQGSASIRRACERFRTGLLRQRDRISIGADALRLLLQTREGGDCIDVTSAEWREFFRLAEYIDVNEREKEGTNGGDKERVKPSQAQADRRAWFRRLRAVARLTAVWSLHVVDHYDFTCWDANKLEIVAKCAQALPSFGDFALVANAVLLQRHELSLTCNRIDHIGQHTVVNQHAARTRAPRPDQPLQRKDVAHVLDFVQERRHIIFNGCRCDTQAQLLEHRHRVLEWVQDHTGDVVVAGRAAKQYQRFQRANYHIQFDRYGLLVQCKKRRSSPSRQPQVRKQATLQARQPAGSSPALVTCDTAHATSTGALADDSANGSIAQADPVDQLRASLATPLTRRSSPSRQPQVRQQATLQATQPAGSSLALVTCDTAHAISTGALADDSANASIAQTDPVDQLQASLATPLTAFARLHGVEPTLDETPGVAISMSPQRIFSANEHRADSPLNCLESTSCFSQGIEEMPEVSEFELQFAGSDANMSRHSSEAYQDSDRLLSMDPTLSDRPTLEAPDSPSWFSAFINLPGTTPPCEPLSHQHAPVSKRAESSFADYATAEHNLHESRVPFNTWADIPKLLRWTRESPFSDANNDDKVYVATPEQILAAISADFKFDKPVVTTCKFSDNEFHTRADLAKHLYHFSPNTQHAVSNHNAEMSVIAARRLAEMMESGAGGAYSFLNPSALHRAHIAPFMLNSRFRLLDALMERIKHRTGSVGAASPSSNGPDPLQYSILGLPSSYLQPHLDHISGSQYRVLFGRPQLVITLHSDLTSEERAAFADDPRAWRPPPHKSQLIQLHRDDVVLFPAGVTAIRAFYNNELSLTHFGSVWDFKAVRDTLTSLSCVLSYPSRVNVPEARFPALLLDELDNWISHEPNLFLSDHQAAERNEICHELLQLIKDLRLKSCKCASAGDDCRSDSCICAMSQRQCNEWCSEDAEQRMIPNHHVRRER